MTNEVLFRTVRRAERLKGVALEAMEFQRFRSEIRERGLDWSKPLPRGESFDHFTDLTRRTLKSLCKTPGQESAAFGWTAGIWL